MHDVIKHSAQTSINSWIVFSQRNCIFFFRIFYYWSSMRKISVKSKKTVCFQNKRTKNPETLWYILKKTDTLLEILLLKNCRNFQIWQNFQIRCAIWYYLYNLKNVKNTHGGDFCKSHLEVRKIKFLKMRK